MLHVRPSLLLIAMGLPTLAAWLYFDLLAGTRAAAPLYFTAKLIQLALPVAAWLWARRDGDRPPARRLPSLAAGLLSGTGIVVATLIVFAAGEGFWRSTGLTPAIGRKLADFSIDGVGHYLLMAFGLAVVHSFFEEVYWRWLVFGGLVPRLGPRAGGLLASVTFAAHHVIVLHQLFGEEHLWSVAIPLAALVAVAGGLWAWLYARYGSLLGPWLSHVLADAAILWVGYRLVWG